MLTKEKILEEARKKGTVKSADFQVEYKVSRQYVTKLLSQLVAEKKIMKIGSTRSAFYTTDEHVKKHPDILPSAYTLRFANKDVEEHKISEEIKKHFIQLDGLKENIKSIFEYALLEMLNNAIEHSTSEKISVFVGLHNDILTFEVDDMGVGAFRNIMKNKHLHSETEAIQDLLKGKMTTAPKLHSGEGIFFTSKVGQEFILDSYGYQFIVDNIIKDVFIKKVRGQKQGTNVTFKINVHDTHHLDDVFRAYTNIGEDSDYGFDKTEIRVRLYTMGGVHISRSQARRVLTGLEKFKIIVMDYDRVPTVGQAFADEIYRVFHDKRPDIAIQDINMNEAVGFMVKRAQKEAEIGR